MSYDPDLPVEDLASTVAYSHVCKATKQPVRDQRHVWQTPAVDLCEDVRGIAVQRKTV